MGYIQGSIVQQTRATCKDCGAVFTMRVFDEHRMCLACKKRIEEIASIIETCDDGLGNVPG